jgi:hypothetical protein
MKKATLLPVYKNVADFEAPEGIQAVLIDPESSQLATTSCPATRAEVYVTGSAPTQLCELHGGHGSATSAGGFLSHIFGGGAKPVDPSKLDSYPTADGETVPIGPDGKPLPLTEEAQKKKKNPLQKVFGIFGGKKKDSDKAAQKPPE